jgi:hypothetical protein
VECDFYRLFISERQLNIIHPIMKRLNRAALKARILRLASLKCTGAPADLAGRLEIGVRTVKRLVREIRDGGTRIRYCHLNVSYVTGTDNQKYVV